MITVHFISLTSDGVRHQDTVQTPPGRSLMEAASAAGIDGIAADCGGLLTCATCHVITSAEWAASLPGASADEQAMLDFTAVPRQPNSRLSCQIQLTPDLDGLMVELPATQY
jgi:ferredoxin, 2Fe-2S